jgi:DNA-directed RNA polymerase specialized sigma subunit
MGLRPTLSKDEELRLIKNANHGSAKAKTILLWHYEYLIYKIVNKYSPHETSSYNRDDLLQEGRIGFLQSLSNFNPKKKCRLSTFSPFYITRNVCRFMDSKMRMIRVPLNKVIEINKLLRKANNDEVKTKLIEEKYGSILKIYGQLTELAKVYNACLWDAPYRDSAKLKELFDKSPVYIKSLETTYKFFGLFGYKEQTMNELSKFYKISPKGISFRIRSALWGLKKYLDEKHITLNDLLE